VTLGSAITATNINFDPLAGIFTINTNFSVLTLQGTGIVNDSGLTQTINNNPGGQTNFSVTSSAGTATITNDGAADVDGFGDFTSFSNTSTAKADRPSRSKPISLDMPKLHFLEVRISCIGCGRTEDCGPGTLLRRTLDKR